MKANARDHEWKNFFNWLYRTPQMVVEEKKKVRKDKGKKEKGEHGFKYFYVEPLKYVLRDIHLQQHQVFTY